jgi:hypothetical protein
MPIASKLLWIITAKIKNNFTPKDITKIFTKIANYLGKKHPFLSPPCGDFEATLYGSNGIQSAKKGK